MFFPPSAAPAEAIGEAPIAARLGARTSQNAARLLSIQVIQGTGSKE
jgi:hypothetical protein